jgi:Ricin-type beta-trefoil lectin domain-like/PASTA domain
LFSIRHRLLALVGVTLLGAAVGLAGAAAPAHADAAGWRSMTNVANGKCIDDALEDNLKAQIWTCVNGNPHDDLPDGMEQMWTIDNSVDRDHGSQLAYVIRNWLTNRCLSEVISVDVPRPVRASSSCGQDAEIWRIVYENDDASGWYQVLQNTESGLCLEPAGNSSVNGTPLQQNTCDRSFTNRAQQWRLGEDLSFPAGVTVPGVLGADQQTAANALNSAGFMVSTSFNSDCASQGDVEVQDPSGNAIMSPGATVNITVSTCPGGGGGGGGGGDDGGGGIPR